MATTNASARAGTVWSIRNLLVTAVALLALFGIGISGHVLRNASLERATAADAASVNETADMLLESAGQRARERGATNLAGSLIALQPRPPGRCRSKEEWVVSAVPRFRDPRRDFERCPQVAREEDPVVAQRPEQI